MTKEQYLANGDYLPDFMKDFHDQKDLFKTIYDQYGNGNNKALLEKVNWVDAQCFTIDVFLWFMASNGYKLQKIRKSDVEFDDIQETIAEFTDIRNGKIGDMLNKIMNVDTPEYVLNFCSTCFQMTNHLNDTCCKCKK